MNDSTYNVKDENVINNPRVAYSHKHKKMTMNNISNSGGLTARKRFWKVYHSRHSVSFQRRRRSRIDVL